VSILIAIVFANLMAACYGESLACAQAAVRVGPNLQRCPGRPAGRGAQGHGVSAAAEPSLSVCRYPRLSKDLPAGLMLPLGARAVGRWQSGGETPGPGSNRLNLALLGLD